MYVSEVKLLRHDPDDKRRETVSFSGVNFNTFDKNFLRFYSNVPTSIHHFLGQPSGIVVINSVFFFHFRRK
jgi:hypothetical protein